MGRPLWLRLMLWLLPTRYMELWLSSTTCLGGACCLRDCGMQLRLMLEGGCHRLLLWLLRRRRLLLRLLQRLLQRLLLRLRLLRLQDERQQLRDAVWSRHHLVGFAVRAHHELGHVTSIGALRWLRRHRRMRRRLGSLSRGLMLRWRRGRQMGLRLGWWLGMNLGLALPVKRWLLLLLLR